MREMMKKSRNTQELFLNTAEKVCEEDTPDYAEWLKVKFEQGFDVDEMRLKLQTPLETEFNAICHLDPWFNNLLCKVYQCITRCLK